MSEVRLIDANALKYKNLAEVNGRLTYVLTAEEIDNAPTVETQTKLVANVTFNKEQMEELVEKAKADILEQIERPQGEWKYETKFDGIGWWYCSNCCEHKEWIGKNSNFCPNCGADMRGEKNE